MRERMARIVPIFSPIGSRKIQRTNVSSKKVAYYNAYITPGWNRGPHREPRRKSNVVIFVS